MRKLDDDSLIMFLFTLQGGYFPQSPLLTRALDEKCSSIICYLVWQRAVAKKNNTLDKQNFFKISVERALGDLGLSRETWQNRQKILMSKNIISYKKDRQSGNNLYFLDIENLKNLIVDYLISIKSSELDKLDFIPGIHKKDRNHPPRPVFRRCPHAPGPEFRPYPPPPGPEFRPILIYKRRVNIIKSKEEEERSDLANASHCPCPPAAPKVENDSNALKIDSDQRPLVRTRKRKQKAQIPLLKGNESGLEDLRQVIFYLKHKNECAGKVLSSVPRGISAERLDTFNATGQMMANYLGEPSFSVENWKEVIDKAFESQWFLTERPRCFSLDGLLEFKICKNTLEDKYKNNFSSLKNKKKYTDEINEDIEIF